MLIERIETWSCSIPLPSPLSFGAFTIGSRQYAAVRVSVRGGLVADCIAHTRRSPVDVAIADLFAPTLVGKNASDHSERLADMDRVMMAVESDGVVGRACSMLEICLWDLKAKELGIPLWKLFGGVSRAVRVGLVEGYEIAGETEEDISNRLIGRVDQGFGFLKMEAAHYDDPQAVRRILTRTREGIADDVRFTCDLAWSCKSAREGLSAAEAWKDLGVSWIEDPLYRTKIEEIAFLRSRSPVPVGMGDEVTRPLDLDTLMDANAVDVVRVDATTIGGFTAALDLTARAASRGLRTSYHVNPEIHRHCVFATTCVDHLEMFPTDRPFDCSHMLLEQSAFDDVRNGKILPPDAPGTGLSLDMKAVQRFAYRNMAVGH